MTNKQIRILVEINRTMDECGYSAAYVYIPPPTELHLPVPVLDYCIACGEDVCRCPGGDDGREFEQTEAWSKSR